MAGSVKAPHTNLRPALMRIALAALRLIVRPASWILALTPFAGPQIRVARTLAAIHRFEEQGAMDEARALRDSALASTPNHLSAPLWSSEGSDLLYQKKDYPLALAAFRNAMVLFEEPKSVDIGIAQADRVYAGAAWAALMVGDRESAMDYYKEFSEYLDALEKALEKSTWLRTNLDWHHETRERLHDELGDLPAAARD